MSDYRFYGVSGFNDYFYNFSCCEESTERKRPWEIINAGNWKVCKKVT